MRIAMPTRYPIFFNARTWTDSDEKFSERKPQPRSDPRLYSLHVAVGLAAGGSFGTARSSTTRGSNACGKSTNCRRPGGSFPRPSIRGFSTCSGPCTWPAGPWKSCTKACARSVPTCPAAAMSNRSCGSPPCCTTWATARSVIFSTSILRILGLNHENARRRNRPPRVRRSDPTHPTQSDHAVGRRRNARSRASRVSDDPARRRFDRRTAMAAILA